MAKKHNPAEAHMEYCLQTFDVVVMEMVPVPIRPLGGAVCSDTWGWGQVQEKM